MITNQVRGSYLVDGPLASAVADAPRHALLLQELKDFVAHPRRVARLERKVERAVLVVQLAEESAPYGLALRVSLRRVAQLHHKRAELVSETHRRGSTVAVFADDVAHEVAQVLELLLNRVDRHADKA